MKNKKKLHHKNFQIELSVDEIDSFISINNISETSIIKISSEINFIGLFENSYLIKNDDLIICCGNKVFSISLPELKINWEVQADTAACFAVYNHKGNVIVHGEMEISMINNQGELLWQKGGADIFTTISEENNFKITDHYIFVRDWNNQEYKFDFSGNSI
jgi:hypothetical protein